MRHRSIRLFTVILALAGLAPSAFGSGYATVVHIAAQGTLAAAEPAAPSFAPERAIVEQRLVDLGYEPGAASEAADLLRPEDLIVLIEHPLMLQRAGELDHLMATYIFGGLIVAGIVVLAVAGTGSVHIN